MTPSPLYFSHLKHPFRTVVTLILGLSIFFAGCSSMRPFPVSEASVAVHVGDFVRVESKSGQTVQFKVTAIEKDALVGEKIRVTFDEMTSIAARQIDKTRTALVEIGAVVFVVLAVVALTSGGPKINFKASP